MSKWRATKARLVLRALKRIGWREKREAKGSHLRLEREGWPDVTWAHHAGAELGSGMLAKIGKETGLQPGDL